MSQFRDFEDIEAWQKARELSRRVREICKREKVRNDFAFVDQITRASRSIKANIAEGNDAMTTTEFITYLGYAKRSAAETRSHLYDALDEEYIAEEEFQELCALSREITRMTAGLIHHLQSLNTRLKRTFKVISNQLENQSTNKHEGTTAKELRLGGAPY